MDSQFEHIIETCDALSEGPKVSQNPHYATDVHKTLRAHGWQNVGGTPGEQIYHHNKHSDDHIVANYKHPTDHTWAHKQGFKETPLQAGQGHEALHTHLTNFDDQHKSAMPTKVGFITNKGKWIGAKASLGHHTHEEVFDHPKHVKTLGGDNSTDALHNGHLRVVSGQAKGSAPHALSIEGRLNHENLGNAQKMFGKHKDAIKHVHWDETGDKHGKPGDEDIHRHGTHTVPSHQFFNASHPDHIRGVAKSITAQFHQKETTMSNKSFKEQMEEVIERVDGLAGLSEGHPYDRHTDQCQAPGCGNPLRPGRADKVTVGGKHHAYCPSCTDKHLQAIDAKYPDRPTTPDDDMPAKRMEQFAGPDHEVIGTIDKLGRVNEAGRCAGCGKFGATEPHNAEYAKSNFADKSSKLCKGCSDQETSKTTGSSPSSLKSRLDTDTERLRNQLVHRNSRVGGKIGEATDPKSDSMPEYREGTHTAICTDCGKQHDSFYSSHPEKGKVLCRSCFKGWLKKNSQEEAVEPAGGHKEVEIAFRVPGKGGFKRKKFPHHDAAEKFVTKLRGDEGDDIEVRYGQEAHESLEIDEAEVDHSQYIGSHGKSARGQGNWFIGINTKQIDFMNHKEGVHYVQHNGHFSDAVKKAKSVAPAGARLYAMP